MPPHAAQTLLLTPGPLTTSPQTRAALGRDWGSRDGDFIRMSEAMRTELASLAGVAGSHAAIPVQGSGTFAVEAMVQSLVPRDGTLLVAVNGAYGRRIVEIARRCRRAVVALEAPEDARGRPRRGGGSPGRRSRHYRRRRWSMSRPRAACSTHWRRWPGWCGQPGGGCCSTP